MFESIKRAMKKSLIPEDDLGAKKENKTIMASLRENMVYLYGQFGTSSDFMVREITIADIPAAVVTCEGMVDKDLLARSVDRKSVV